MTEEWWIWCKRRHAKEATSVNEVTNLYQANELNQYTNINEGAVEPVYDADGNMTQLGPWAYDWDGENRLISVSSNGVPVVQNQYDYMSRRIMKATATQTNTFLYDGWNLIREDLGAAAPSSRSYVWGLDLSQSLQGAGGVGGLLMVVKGRANPPGEPLFPSCDANGNISEYVDGGGSVVAQYEYDAFGNEISRSGAEAQSIPFRFSTKYFDDETSLYYYGYRFYCPSLGRWINRDPIEYIVELKQRKIFMNNGTQKGLYRFNGNNSLTRYDIYGLWDNPIAPDGVSPCDIDDLQGDSLGGVVCYKGVKYPCVWTSSTTPDWRSKCIGAHEQVHIDDDTTDDCKCDDEGSRMGWPDPDGQGPGECNAYKAEMECYKSESDNCKGDFCCILPMWSSYHEAKNIGERFCHDSLPNWDPPGFMEWWKKGGWKDCK